MVNIKGYEFNLMRIKDSHSRRAQKFKNNIIETLRAFNLTEDDVEIDLEPVAIRRVPASASWYLDGQHLHYSYKASSYVENLYVVSRVIELATKSVLSGEKTVEEFIAEFRENKDVEQERREARELLGVEHDCLDLALITKKYKLMAKELHPDMDTGDTQKFKALNHAHKVLKRELE